MEQLQKKTWILRGKDLPSNSRERITQMSKTYGIPPLVATIMLLNHIESAKDFLEPTLEKLHDPFLMKGMKEAVERIISALSKGENILVYGDYDVDGITSTAIMVRFLKSIGAASVQYYVPDRFKDGYGLHKQAIDLCREQGITLLITVDCGITSIEEVAYAKEYGIDVIITDHHECGNEVPESVAVLNPKQQDCPYPFPSLAGVGVAFKLIEALAKTKEMASRTFYTQYLDMVALGTVADVMPLVGENRILVKNGLETLSATSSAGLRALLKQSGAKNTPITTTTIGFMLSPRINAAGRMDNPQMGVELLLAENGQEAENLAMRLDEINKDRQKEEQKIYEEAVSMLLEDKTYENQPVLVLYKENWHNGVIGIVASKITEKFHKPCLLISGHGEEGKGSGRSIKGFNLFNALSSCGDLLIKYGGHELAAGLTIATENLPAFRQKINALAGDLIEEEALLPSLYIDSLLPIRFANLNTLDKLLILQPYGMHNPTPLFCGTHLTIKGIYTMSEGKHIRLLLSDGETVAQAVGFSMGDLKDKLACGDVIDIVYQLDSNIYRGERQSQILLKDLRKSS